MRDKIPSCLHRRPFYLQEKTDLLLTEIQPHVQVHLPALAGRAYHCQCGNTVFFRNSKCLTCQTPLGYEPSQSLMLSLMPAEQADTWVEWQAPSQDTSPVLVSPQEFQTQSQTQGLQQSQSQGFQQSQSQGFQQSQSQGWQQSQDQQAVPDELVPAPVPSPVFVRCANLKTGASCNWLLPLHESEAGVFLCRACRLNRNLLDLNDPERLDNGKLYGLTELAKRRLVSALIVLGLPVESKVSEDTERGLMFDLLRSPIEGPRVMTGHNSGLITLDLQEADDSLREAVRHAMHEPYRTLLGHFRHEVGHYYWDRLVWGTDWMEGFHELFGDETQDYAASLKRNYEEGPPAQWWLHFVSAYASTHPWEDWAECWAHYLHMRDTIDTAMSFGLTAANAELEFTPFTLDDLYRPQHPQAQIFLDFLNDWTRLTTMLTEMSRSMGQPDFYPFTLPREVVAKLHFIHILVSSLQAAKKNHI
jgi:hypothetical protein